jgi:predicted PurR-regulated permease PerM
MAPLVGLVQRRLSFRRGLELRRGAAVGIAYAGVFGAIALAMTWIAPHVANAIKEAPKAIQSPNSHPFEAVTARLPGWASSAVNHVVATGTDAIGAGAQQIGRISVRLASYLPWLVLIPVLAFFLLKDAEVFRDGAMRRLPVRWRPSAAALLDRIDAALAAYIRAQLVACVIVGVVVSIGFSFLRVPAAVLLGIAAGIAEFLPLVGPLVIAVASAVIAATRAPMLAVWVLVFLGILRGLEDYVIYPRLIGSNVHLHPLAVILAVLAGAELSGAVGVLLSVPALAIAIAAYRTFAHEAHSDVNRQRAMR